MVTNEEQETGTKEKKVTEIDKLKVYENKNKLGSLWHQLEVDQLEVFWILPWQGLVWKYWRRKVLKVLKFQRLYYRQTDRQHNSPFLESHSNRCWERQELMRANTSALKCVKHRIGLVPACLSLMHPQTHPFVCSHEQPKAPCVFCVRECSHMWGLWRCYHTALLKFGDGAAGGICPLWASDCYHSSRCYWKAIRFTVAPHCEAKEQTAVTL